MRTIRTPIINAWKLESNSIFCVWQKGNHCRDPQVTYATVNMLKNAIQSKMHHWVYIFCTQCWWLQCWHNMARTMMIDQCVNSMRCLTAKSNRAVFLYNEHWQQYRMFIYQFYYNTELDWFFKTFSNMDYFPGVHSECSKTTFSLATDESHNLQLYPSTQKIAMVCWLAWQTWYHLFMQTWGLF